MAAHAVQMVARERRTRRKSSMNPVAVLCVTRRLRATDPKAKKPKPEIVSPIRGMVVSPAGFEPTTP